MNCGIQMPTLFHEKVWEKSTMRMNNFTRQNIWLRFLYYLHHQNPLIKVISICLLHILLCKIFHSHSKSVCVIVPFVILTELSHDSEKEEQMWCFHFIWLNQMSLVGSARLKCSSVAREKCIPVSGSVFQTVEWDLKYVYFEWFWKENPCVPIRTVIQKEKKYIVIVSLWAFMRVNGIAIRKML